MKVKKVEVASVQVRPDRQRKDLGDLESLQESLKARGQLQPIIIESNAEGIWLVAGERRLAAAKTLAWPHIWATERKDLDKIEAELIELDENVKRKDLHWTEFAKAVQRIHSIMTARDPKWTQASTCEYLGYAPQAKSVERAIALEGKINEQLAKAPTLESAYNSLARVQTRALSDIANEVLAGPRPQPKPVAQPFPSAPLAPAPRSDDEIENTSFLSWAPEYKGHKFNLIHCDFPYGIDIGQSDQMRHETEQLYDDSKDVYWQLLHCFAEHYDKFTYPSAHLMFWFSMEYYTETYKFLSENTDFVILPKPLVWHKSDGSGVIPDPRRRPRNTYEVALMGIRGDRFILEPVASSYACPIASKRLHPSEKPEPMLKHFFRLFVNEETSIFDPTAGGGSALRAADEMGAKRVHGLELDASFAQAANGALRIARNKRRAANVVQEV